MSGIGLPSTSGNKARVEFESACIVGSVLVTALPHMLLCFELEEVCRVFFAHVESELLVNIRHCAWDVGGELSICYGDGRVRR